MAISGLYSLDGYAILSDGEPIYSAGNLEGDSQCYRARGSAGTLDLAALRRYCESTAAELAEEREESLGQCIEADNAADYFCGG